MQRDKGHDTNRREKRERGEEMRVEEREREREEWRTQGKTITYPSCTPGAHFHPSKRGKESHRLRYAGLPPIEHMHIYMSIHAYTHIHECVCCYIH